MTMLFKFNDNDKHDAMKEYVQNHKLVPKGYIVSNIYPSLGEVEFVEETKDENSNNKNTDN